MLSCRARHVDGALGIYAEGVLRSLKERRLVHQSWLQINVRMSTADADAVDVKYSLQSRV